VLTFILPFLEQQPLYDQIDLDYDWCELGTSRNREVTAIDINDFICPSAEGRPGTYTTDYQALVDINDSNSASASTPAGYCFLEGLGQVTQNRSLESLIGLLQDTPTPARRVTDGLSKTFLFFESAGRPNIYDKNRQLMGLMWEPPYNKSKPGETKDPFGITSDYQWADPEVYGVWGNNKECGLSTVMNCDNYTGVYSFHPGGANIVFGDGSVTFLSENIEIETFISLFTRAADDLVTDYSSQ